MVVDALVLGLLAASAVFFAGGTLGLLRFPDAFTRLHALSKADNLGLGLLALALALKSGEAVVGAKLALIWLVAMFVGSAASYLVARHALGVATRKEPPP